MAWTTIWTVLADFNTTLNLKVAVSATTATLDSATDDDGVALPTWTYFLTLDGNSTTSKEYIKCTLTSTALTAIQSVSRQGALTTGFARVHRKGATVTITDFASIRKITDLLDGTTNFPAGTVLWYDWTATISTANQLATKAYVDGVAIAGSPDSSTTVKGIWRVSVAPVSAATPIFVGDNDGRVPTQAENDALVGNNTDIAVGSGNKMVTQTGLQKNAESYAATATGNDTYVITLSPIPTSLVNGMHLKFKADVANTWAATLNVNSLGAISLVTGLSTALATGDIVANQVVEVVYNSTWPVFQVLNPASALLVAPAISGILGTWASATLSSSTLASTDLLLVGSNTTTAGSAISIKTDSANPPTTIRTVLGGDLNGYLNSFCVPVKKNEYYLIAYTAGSSGCTAFQIPIGT